MTTATLPEQFIMSKEDIAKLETAVKEEAKPQEVHLAQLEGIAKMDVMGIPLGAAALGAAGVIAVNWVRNRFFPSFQGTVAQLVMAWLVKEFGPKTPLGRTGSEVTALALALTAVTPIVTGLFGKLLPSQAGTTTTGTASGAGWSI